MDFPMVIDLIVCAEHLHMKLLTDKTYLDSEDNWHFFLLVRDNDDRAQEELEKDIRILKLLFAFINNWDVHKVVSHYKNAEKIQI